MRLLRTTLFVFCLVMLLPIAGKTQTVIEKLHADYEAGLLSSRDYAINLGYTAIAPNRLSKQYALGAEPSNKCGFITRHMIQSEYGNMDAEHQRLFKAFAFRASSFQLPESYISPSGLFRIHYTTTATPDQVDLTDSDNSTVPDWIEEAGIAYDSAHRLLVDTLGFTAPPADNGKDGSEYDVYIYNQSNYGETGFGTDEGTVQNENGTAWISYIVMDNDFSGSQFFTNGLDAMRVTAVHEYFHAVQLAYVWRSADAHFYETSSTWIEDVQYDDVNDYLQYMPTIFGNLDKSMDSRDGLFEYGMSIWLHFLVKRNDDNRDIVRNIWEKMPTIRAEDAWEQTVEEDLSSTFEAELAEFYMWNYFTGSRANTSLYYPEGDLYPEVTVDDTLTVESDTTLTADLRYLSANYIVARRQQPSTFVADFIVERSDMDAWAGNSILLESIRQPVITPFQFVLDTLLRAQASGQGNSPDFVIIPIVSAKTSRQGTTSYPLKIHISTKGANNIEGNLLLPSFPNPADFSKVNIVRIPFVIEETADVEVKIFSANGRLVKTFPRRSYAPDLYELLWDGKDNDGENVPSGIYLYVLDSPVLSGMKKIAVIR